MLRQTTVVLVVDQGVGAERSLSLAQNAGDEAVMNYYFSRTIDTSHDHAIDRVTAALARKGFGILTTIDVAATMKSKLGVEFRPYTILGACNPHFAWRALQEEDKIGTMLPCNVVVSEVGAGRTEIAAVDPVASMASIANPRLAELAETARFALFEAVQSA